MSKLTISLITALAISVAINWFAGSEVVSLNIKVGSIELKLEKANEDTIRQKELYNDEHKALIKSKALVDRLNKELIDVKVNFERSFGGTTTIGGT